MNQQPNRKQILVQSTSLFEGMAIGGAVILTLMGWHLVDWLCWAAGAGACWGYLYLIANPKTFWLTVIAGIAMAGTVGYYIGAIFFNAHFLRWAFAVVGALCSISSKIHVRELVQGEMGLP